MADDDIAVLYEDNHLLALNKPAGLPTMGVAADRDSLLVRARRYIKHRYQKPGNVYLGAMSRLDAPVSGVVLLARTSKAAARLTEQFRNREVTKIYWALVAAALPEGDRTLVDHLAEDPRHRRMHRVAADAAGAREARLSYRRLSALPAATLLEVQLDSGRKHQIRVQLSARGWPILGDRKYGSSQPFLTGIALHSRRLAFTHPTRDETIELIAPLPPSWRRYGVAVT